MDRVSKSKDYSVLPFVLEHLDKHTGGQLIPDPEDHMAIVKAEEKDMGSRDFSGSFSSQCHGAGKSGDTVSQWGRISV